MPDLERYYNEIDTARARRARELSEIKFRFADVPTPDPLNIASKAAIVLTYANWEGFYNECAKAYLGFLQECGGKVRNRDWMLLIGALNVEFDSLRDRNHSIDARLGFVRALQGRIECGFDVLDADFISARSNLNFERLSWCFSVLSFDLSPLQPYRLKLDRELVRWRHLVAHGDQPDLSAVDVRTHVDFASSMLIMLADQFQQAMLRRLA